VVLDTTSFEFIVVFSLFLHYGVVLGKLTYVHYGGDLVIAILIDEQYILPTVLSWNNQSCLIQSIYQSLETYQQTMSKHHSTISTFMITVVLILPIKPLCIASNGLTHEDLRDHYRL
jgi:hypothetical protein